MPNMLFTTLNLTVCYFVVLAIAGGGTGEHCYTLSGWKGAHHGHLPRSTWTRTLPPTTTTLTQTSTVSTTITLPTITDTVTSTSVITETSTESSTSTIPAPAEFTPIYQSSGYTSLSPGARKRAVLDVLLKRDQTSSALRYPKGYGPKKPFKKLTPQAIRCVTTTRQTSTVFTTVTTTSTSTVTPPDATTTVTSTSTTTTTTTSTTSFYAACATNNIIGPQIAEGTQQYVQGVGNSDPNGVQGNIPASSAYDCCVICLTGSGVANCQNTIYDADTGICNVIGGDAAACGVGGTQANPFGGYVLLLTSVYNRYDINGPCGVLGPDPNA